MLDVDDTGRAEAGAGGRCCRIHDQDVEDARFLHASSSGEGPVEPRVHTHVAVACGTLGARGFTWNLLKIVFVIKLALETLECQVAV